MVNIHKTAIVAGGATIGDDVYIGAFSIIGADVKLGNGVKLHSHIVIDGDTDIGDNSEIFPFASIGTEPQDLKFAGEKSKLIIGKNNKIREYVTMNPGTKGDNLLTEIGDNCLFMISSHIAHDCIIGNNVILANNATLAGHVVVGDFAIIGGLSAVHQFVRIGAHAMIGGMSGVENDVIPFGSVMGERANLSGLNIIGMKRRGFSKNDIHILRNAYKMLFSDQGTLIERTNEVAKIFGKNAVVANIVEFINKSSSRGLTQPEINK